MAAPTYDFWLLDLDGTLVDVEPTYVHDVMGEVGDRLGVEITDRQAEVLWHGYGGQRDRVIDGLSVDAATFWATFHEVEDPTKRSESTFLFEDAGVVPDLDRPTGLVTHCQQYLTDPVLRHHDIADWFEAPRTSARPGTPDSTASTFSATTPTSAALRCGATGGYGRSTNWAELSKDLGRPNARSTLMAR